MTEANAYFYDGAEVALLNGQYTDVFTLRYAQLAGW